jgi:hypothetical protein
MRLLDLESNTSFCIFFSGSKPFAAKEPVKKYKNPLATA